MSSLTLRGIRKSFGAVDIIKGVDLDIAAKEFIVFVGPSGCGKSTLLRMIAGLETITAGDLLIGGERMNDVEPSRRGIAMVFQSYALYPHMTVRENMGFALRFAGLSKAEIEKQVAEAARILELTPLLDRKPKALSGGQRQRVAIGRAIVRHPKVFLFDEPLSNLDAELRVHMRIEIAKLHKQLATTIIYVTHDQVEAMTLADRIVVLKEGEVAQVGTPLGLFDDPDNLFVAGFIGSPKINVLSGTIETGGAAGPRVRLSGHGVTIPIAHVTGPLAEGMPVSVGLRPQHLGQGGQATLDLSVQVVEHMGTETFVHAAGGEGGLLTAALKGGRSVKAGDRIAIGFDPVQALLFDPAGRRIR